MNKAAWILASDEKIPRTHLRPSVPNPDVCRRA